MLSKCVLCRFLRNFVAAWWIYLKKCCSPFFKYIHPAATEWRKNQHKTHVDNTLEVGEVYFKLGSNLHVFYRINNIPIQSLIRLALTYVSKKSNFTFGRPVTFPFLISKVSNFEFRAVEITASGYRGRSWFQLPVHFSFFHSFYKPHHF